MRSLVIVLLVALLQLAQAQSTPTPIVWPPAWNATITVTMSDTVIGAAAHVHYDSTRQMQVVQFTQCAVAGGVVNNQPCVNVQSSQPDNFGIWTILPDGSCCVDFRDLGSLPPTWPTTMNYTSSVTVYGKPALRFDGGGHTYYVQDNAHQLPVFVGPEEWTWSSGWKVGPQPAEPFEVAAAHPISSCTLHCASLTS